MRGLTVPPVSGKRVGEDEGPNSPTCEWEKGSRIYGVEQSLPFVPVKMPL